MSNHDPLTCDDGRVFLTIELDRLEAAQFSHVFVMSDKDVPEARYTPQQLAKSFVMAVVLDTLVEEGELHLVERRPLNA